MIKLPDDFFFGAAMSGPQTEGAYTLDNRLPSIWDKWSNIDINSFYNKVGSYNGNNFYYNYEEDIKLLKSLNLQSFRTSIQWSRLIDKNGNLNKEGAKFYHKVIDFANEQGIDIFINLYHFDMPSHLFDKGGWENREVIEAYVNYAKIAFKEFGKKVKHWFTFNEPIVEPMCMYEQGIWYPKLHSLKRAINVQYNITLAHCLAVEEFRKLNKENYFQKGTKIGLINAFCPSYTREEPTDEDLEAVRITDGIHNRWWLDVVSKGRLPIDILDTLKENNISPNIRPGDFEIIKLGKVDWLGVNYYQPNRVQATTEKFDEHGNPVFYKPYIWSKRKMNIYRGWEIYPKGIYDFGMKIKEEFPNLEFFISENGIGVANEEKFLNKNNIIEDKYRIEFVKEHLEWIAKSINDGVKCRGYHYWAVIDNWSWANAFKNRYGFIRVELDNDYKRVEKESATWLKKVAKTKIVE
ncbi:glycoside hydrolase family 1 protein [Clostridium carnis]